MKYRRFVLVVLGVAAHANAGAVIELVPDISGPYLPGQAVSVDVWLHNDDAVGHDLRLVALDIRALRPPGGGVQVFVLDKGALLPLR